MKPDPARQAIDASLRDALVQPRGEYQYVIHPLTDGVPRCDAALLRAFAHWAHAEAAPWRPNVILAPEAMALPIGAALSLGSGWPLLVARKRDYRLPGEVAVPSRTGYGASTLHLNDLGESDRVLVVDDVLSTAGTLDALLPAIASCGATVVGVVVFLDKGQKAEAVARKHGVPVVAMRRIRVVDGKVELA